MVRWLLVALILVPLPAAAVGHRGVRHRLHAHLQTGPRGMHRVHPRQPSRLVALPPQTPAGRPHPGLNVEGLPGVGRTVHASRELAWNWLHALSP